MAQRDGCHRLTILLTLLQMGKLLASKASFNRRCNYTLETAWLRTSTVLAAADDALTMQNL